MIKYNDNRPWIVRVFRPYDWIKAEELFSEFETELHRKKVHYDTMSSILSDRWGKRMPSFPKFDRLTDDLGEFTSPEEAEAALVSALKFLEGYSPWEIGNTIDKKLSRSFIEKIKREAPSSTSMIVFKSSYKPYGFNVENFNKAVRNHEVAFISIMGIAPAWAAILPDTDIEPTFCPRDFKGYF